MQVRPVLAIVVATSFLSLPTRSSRGKDDQEAQQVVTASPLRRAVTLTGAYNCQIRAQRQVTIRALERGKIEAFAVKEGQAVSTGDPLFTLLPAPNRASAERGQQELVTCRAPFDGTVDRLLRQQGSLVDEGDQVATLSDNSVMWVYFHVPEAAYREYLANPKLIETLRVELVLSDGSTLNGKVAAIESDSQNGIIVFRADFPNPGRLLHHGQTGTVLVRRVVKDSILIPLGAIFEADAKQYVYAIDKDHVAHRREIDIRNVSGDFLVVGKGLDEHDTIVLEGVRQIHDGDKL